MFSILPTLRSFTRFLAVVVDLPAGRSVRARRNGGRALRIEIRAPAASEPVLGAIPAPPFLHCERAD